MAPTQPQVVSQEGAQVGDENLEAFVADVAVNDSPVPAQVSPPRAPEATEVEVHETFVATDYVVTDPASPEAVQIPDAGRGFLDLPAHRLANGSPEDVFAAGSEDEAPVVDSDEEPEVEDTDDEAVEDDS